MKKCSVFDCGLHFSYICTIYINLQKDYNMAKTYIPPSLEVSPYPYIGVIKSYDKVKKYGYIFVLYKRDIFFHIKNSNILNIEPNTFVAFKVRISAVSGKIEAYVVDTITNYKTELLAYQKNLLVGDINIVYYRHPELVKQELGKRLKEEYALLDNIDDYIDNYNIDEVIDSYSIEVVTGHRYKPGDDDAAWVSYGGDRKTGKFIIENNFKYIRDVYVDTILPLYHEEIFHDRGFCPWEQMLESFGDLTSYRQEAIKKTTEIRNQAKSLYNKQIHKETIVRFLTEKISNESMQYQRNIERSINDSLAYGYKLNYRLNDMAF